jgi:hypothetical protein
VSDLRHYLRANGLLDEHLTFFNRSDFIPLSAKFDDRSTNYLLVSKRSPAAVAFSFVTFCGILAGFAIRWQWSLPRYREREARDRNIGS